MVQLRAEDIRSQVTWELRLKWWWRLTPAFPILPRKPIRQREGMERALQYMVIRYPDQ